LLRWREWRGFGSELDIDPTAGGLDIGRDSPCLRRVGGQPNRCLGDFGAIGAAADGNARRAPGAEPVVFSSQFFSRKPSLAPATPIGYRLYVLANPDTFATNPNTALSIPLSKFLCNDQADSTDILEIELPVLTAVQGGTLVKGPGVIVYTPPPGFSGGDSFQYRLRGRFGGTSVTSVTVYVFEKADQHPTVVSISRREGAAVRVCLLGAPNRNYDVQQSSDLGDWSKVGTLSADAAGSMSYEYTPDPTGIRFYRFRGQ
jgi:hypothetical protein